MGELEGRTPVLPSAPSATWTKKIRSLLVFLLCAAGKDFPYTSKQGAGKCGQFQRHQKSLGLRIFLLSESCVTLSIHRILDFMIGILDSPSSGSGTTENSPVLNLYNPNHVF